MKTVKVTQLEKELLSSIAKSLDAEFRFSAIVLEDVSTDVRRDRGVLSSLIKKGLVFVREERIKWGDPVNIDLLEIEANTIFAVREFTNTQDILWTDFNEDHFDFEEQLVEKIELL